MQFKTWSFPMLAVALGIAGVLLSGGVALLLPNHYTSQATLQITPAQISENMVQSTISNSLNERVQQMETAIVSRGRLARIIQDPRIRLYPNDIRTKPLEDVIQDMKNDIRIDFVALPGGLGKRASAFNIQFTYFDRYKAQLVVQALMNEFDQENMNTQRVDRATSGSLVVLTNASLPVAPLSAKGSGTSQYRSTATLALPQGATEDRIPVLQAEALRPATLSDIITDRHLALYGIQPQGRAFDDAIQTMKQHVTVTPVHFRDLWFMDVSFDYTDAAKAQTAVSRIVDAFSEADRRLYPTAAPHSPALPVVLDVLDSASLPVKPTGPNRLQIALTGGAFGVILAALIVFARRRWKPETIFPLGAVPE